jgi:hypothetical protein
MRKEDLEFAKEYARKYIMKDNPELVLVTGLFGVQGSDFDLCVVGRYHEKHLRKYSNFISIKKYPREYKGQMFEVELASWDYIREGLQEYESFLAWHFQQAHILFDKGGKFESLRKKYSRLTKKELKELVFELYEIALDNYRNAVKAEQRAYPATKQLHIAEAVDSLLKIYYLINGRFIPPLKWRIFLLADLKIKPSMLNERGLENLSVRTLEVLIRKTESVILIQKILNKKDISIL